MINKRPLSFIHFVKLVTQHVQNVYVHVQTHLYYVLRVELTCISLDAQLCDA